MKRFPVNFVNILVCCFVSVKVCSAAPVIVSLRGEISHIRESKAPDADRLSPRAEEEVAQNHLAIGSPVSHTILIDLDQPATLTPWRENSEIYLFPHPGQHDPEALTHSQMHTDNTCYFYAAYLEGDRLPANGNAYQGAWLEMNKAEDFFGILDSNRNRGVITLNSSSNELRIFSHEANIYDWQFGTRLTFRNYCYYGPNSDDYVMIEGWLEVVHSR